MAALSEAAVLKSTVKVMVAGSKSKSSHEDDAHGLQPKTQFALFPEWQTLSMQAGLDAGAK